MLPASRGGRVDLILSLAVVALGVFATAVSLQLTDVGVYAVLVA